MPLEAGETKGQLPTPEPGVPTGQLAPQQSDQTSIVGPGDEVREPAPPVESAEALANTMTAEQN
ncbi:MAG: hypothetical protein RLZZ450_4987, partial [Pseudomonadota bacterium]